MFKKLVKKLAVAATLVCMAATVAATAAACNVETKHPKVRITVEFNEVTYKLDYTLYRNMYPNTVRHFIELSESGIYNNMLVHDYTNSDWFSGGYSYDKSDYNESVAESQADSASIIDYFINHSVAEKYMELFNNNKLTATVFATPETISAKKGDALPTLIGEFENNNHKIKKGALSADFGTLKMYYYDNDDAKGKVQVAFSDDQLFSNYDYKNNRATSLFAMQVSSSSSNNASKYCVFGKMESTKALSSLLSAIQDYYDDNDVADIEVDDVLVNNEIDSYVEPYLEDAGGDIEKDFTLPALPIIIKSVKVTKY